MGIFDFFKKEQNQFSKDELYELGVCPNCWGSQEFDGQYIQYSQQQAAAAKIELNANPKAFIQKFVDEHVSGIKLEEKNGTMHCPHCVTTA